MPEQNNNNKKTQTKTPNSFQVRYCKNLIFCDFEWSLTHSTEHRQLSFSFFTIQALLSALPSNMLLLMGTL